MTMTDPPSQDEQLNAKQLKEGKCLQTEHPRTEGRGETWLEIFLSYLTQWTNRVITMSPDAQGPKNKLTLWSSCKTVDNLICFEGCNPSEMTCFDIKFDPFSPITFVKNLEELHD